MPLITILKQSMLIKDWDTMKLAAHKMIPSFAIFGIDTRFENIARKIQLYYGNEVQDEELKNMVLQLETVCLQACSELEEEFIKIKTNFK